MRIRRCEEEDLERVIEIERLSFDNPYSPFIFESYLGSELFLVALEQKIQGYVIGEIKDERLWIISIAVAPGERLRGVGSLLLDGAIERSERDSVVLTVRVTNRGAIKFYEQNGFDRLNRIDHYYQNGDDAFMMGKTV